MHCTPSLRSFPNVAFETVPMFAWLTMALEYIRQPALSVLSNEKFGIRQTVSILRSNGNLEYIRQSVFSGQTEDLEYIRQSVFSGQTEDLEHIRRSVFSGQTENFEYIRQSVFSGQTENLEYIRQSVLSLIHI